MKIRPLHDRVIVKRLEEERTSPGGIVILDTAGRTTLDEAMMAEAAEIARIAQPTETLLVADSLTGQDAVRTAKAFHERLPLTGLILTRADGDARGGAAPGRVRGHVGHEVIHDLDDPLLAAHAVVKCRLRGRSSCHSLHGRGLGPLHAARNAQGERQQAQETIHRQTPIPEG